MNNKLINVLLLLAIIFIYPFTGAFCQKRNSQETFDEKVRKDRARGVVLPKSDGHYMHTQLYAEDDPDHDYLHASEAAHEAFRDIKFGIRIHWGVYVIDELGESQGFLRLPNDKRQEYQNEYKIFNPTEFNAQGWMDLFKRSGIECMAFTTKHHDGFSMWHTKTRVVRRMNFLDTANVIEPCNVAYSIEETPFKRDIVKELCDAAHKNKIKIDLYFSHPDWYDADFRPYNNHPLGTPAYFADPKSSEFGYSRWPDRIPVPERTPEETARMVSRHRAQLLELLTNYGKIDMMCLDNWLGSDIWPEIKTTIKMMRGLQPDVMLRCRGIGNYGDYYTPERRVPENKENTNMPWMVIYTLADKWSYDSDASHYKGAPWIIHNIIDCAAKGGSFMVGTGPDKTGVFHPEAVRQLEETGKWLKVNGEGIYKTRAREVWKENEVYFTRTKDHKKVFAFVEEWPEKEIVIPSVTPKKGSKIYLLGYKKALKWSQSGADIKVEIPDALQLPENRPCEYAWGFEISLSDNQ